MDTHPRRPFRLSRRSRRRLARVRSVVGAVATPGDRRRAPEPSGLGCRFADVFDAPTPVHGLLRSRALQTDGGEVPEPSRARWNAHWRGRRSPCSVESRRRARLPRTATTCPRREEDIGSLQDPVSWARGMCCMPRDQLSHACQLGLRRTDGCSGGAGRRL
ncbi:hypothetical protein C8Q80DRAFT_1158539 [Daedaleopsis nitida]|nr:hypothetical protein C8Q80DRAFT_1158539 [Daedaleopsis nitida]